MFHHFGNQNHLFDIGQADKDNQNSVRGLPIIRQRLRFDNKIFNFFETTIEYM